MATGRGESFGVGFVVASEAPEAPAALRAPEKKITGSTGRMHGDIPVIRPPTRPMSASVNILSIRSRSRCGSVNEAKPVARKHFPKLLNAGKGGPAGPGQPQKSVSLSPPTYWLGGISTVSIMYTCAFAVDTPPQTRPASLTLRSLPEPVTFSVAPWRVAC